MKNTIKKRNDSGFTLLEVLISIVILSIVILSFLSFFSQALLFSVKEEDNLVGVNIAERILYNIEKDSTIESDIHNKSYLVNSCDNPHSIVSYITDNNELTLDSNDPHRLNFVMNNRSYYSYVTICQSEEERDLSLFRVHIKILQPLDQANKDRLIYETFHYLNLQ